MNTLFENYEVLPKEVLEIVEKIDDSCDYQDLDDHLTSLDKLGYTFEYYLDAVPYNLVSKKFLNFLVDGISQGTILPSNESSKGDDLESLADQVLLDEVFTLSFGKEIEITLDMLMGKLPEIPQDLLQTYKATEQILMKEFNRFIEGKPLHHENKDFNLKTGDVILFHNGYDVPMVSKILGFDNDGDAYLLWDCYWYPINLGRRFKEKIN